MTAARAARAPGRAPAVALALLALLALLPGCRSSLDEQVGKARHAYYAGDVDRAIDLLQQRLDRDPQAPDAQVLRLELASALQAAGRYTEAGNLLIVADNELEVLDYSSAPLGEVAYALFATPRPAYRASRPEKLLVNVENMLNFLGAGDWERAAVEARRARILMLQEDVRPSRRYASALAWGLAGLSLQLAGRDGESDGCFRAAAQDTAGARLAERPGAGEGSVLVVVQNGKVPVRKPADYELFLHDGLHRLQIPALVPRPGGWQRAVVSVDGQPGLEAPLLADLAAQADRRWDDEFPRLLAAAALQMLPRALVGATVKQKLETRHETNPEQDLWAALAGFFTEQLLADALPTDTRCWSLLPRDVRALRLSVPAGEHTIALELLDAPDRPSRRMDWQVSVDEGGFALVNAVTGPFEGSSPLPEPRGGDVSHTPAGQEALELLEAALVWRQVLRD